MTAGPALGGGGGAGFLEAYAAALRRAGSGPYGISDPESDVLLDLAREVAHATERRFAPLSTYLAGQFVLDQVRSGTARDEALSRALAIARQVLDEGG